MTRRSKPESFFSVASANESKSSGAFAILTTGVREFDPRMREVSFSLFSLEMESPSNTKSKSPALNCSMASRIVPADTTKYPADLQLMLRVAKSQESKPTARTTVFSGGQVDQGVYRLVWRGLRPQM